MSILSVEWMGCTVCNETFPAILTELSVELVAVPKPQTSQIEMNKENEPPKKKMASCQFFGDRSPTSSSSSIKEIDVHEVSDDRSFSRSATRKVMNYNYNCCECSFNTNKYGLMKNHMRCHGSSASLSCSHCLSRFKSLPGYQKHANVCLPTSKVNDTDYLVSASDSENEDRNGLQDYSVDHLYGLALQLQGRFRCSEVMTNAIFSNIYTMLHAHDLNLDQLKTSSENLTSQYKRQEAFKKMFKLPEIMKVSINGSGVAVHFIQMISFLLQSPEIRTSTAHTTNEHNIYWTNIMLKTQ